MTFFVTNFGLCIAYKDVPMAPGNPTNSHVSNGGTSPVKKEQTRTDSPVTRSNSFTERHWIRPDLKSRCTWHVGTTEKDPHHHSKKYDYCVTLSTR